MSLKDPKVKKSERVPNGMIHSVKKSSFHHAQFVGQNPLLTKLQQATPTTIFRVTLYVTKVRGPF